MFFHPHIDWASTISSFAGIWISGIGVLVAIGAATGSWIVLAAMPNCP